LKLFDLLEDPPTIYDPDYGFEYGKKLSDAYGGKEKLVGLMRASIAEYYDGARYFGERRPKIGFIYEYRPNRFWREEYYPDSD